MQTETKNGVFWSIEFKWFISFGHCIYLHIDSGQLSVGIFTILLEWFSYFCFIIWWFWVYLLMRHRANWLLLMTRVLSLSVQGKAKGLFKSAEIAFYLITFQNTAPLYKPMEPDLPFRRRLLMGSWGKSLSGGKLLIWSKKLLRTHW